MLWEGGAISQIATPYSLRLWDWLGRAFWMMCGMTVITTSLWLRVN